MKKILFVNGGVREFAKRFKESCERNKLECVSIRTHHNSVIVAGSESLKYVHLGEEIPIESFDYAFIRVKGRYTHLSSLLTYILEHYGVPYNDVSNLEHTMGDEKITQMVRLSLEKMPIPKTLIFSTQSFKKNRDFILKETTFPCVLKTNGSKGQNVWKIQNLSDLEKQIGQIDQELMIIQEFIPNTYDIRALFFDGQLLGAIERSSQDGFYNNASKGGNLKEAELSAEEIRLSKKACQILEVDFGGVDFVRTDKGILFFEINKGPQVYGLESATGLDIPDFLVQKIKKRLGR